MADVVGLFGKAVGFGAGVVIFVGSMVGGGGGGGGSDTGDDVGDSVGERLLFVGVGADG